MASKPTNLTETPLPPDLLTVGEIARYLRFSGSTVRRFAREGTIPSVRVGSEYRFRMAEVQAWIESCSSAGVATEGTEELGSRLRGNDGAGADAAHYED